MLISPLTETQIEDELNRLEMTDTQKKLVHEKTQIISDVLDMPVLPVRGFFTKALIEWQKSKARSVAEGEYTEDVSKDARKESAEQIFAIFRKKLFRICKIRGKLKQLDEAIAAAMKYYLENYAGRPRDTR